MGARQRKGWEGKRNVIAQMIHYYFVEGPLDEPLSSLADDILAFLFPHTGGKK